MKVELIIKLFLISGVLVFLGILTNIIYADRVDLTVEAVGNPQGTPPSLAVVPSVMSVGDLIITQILGGTEGENITVSINNNKLSLDGGCTVSTINDSVTKPTGSIVSIAACSVGTTIITIPGNTHTVTITQRPTPTPTNTPAPTHTPYPTHTPVPTDIKPPTDVTLSTSSSAISMTWNYMATSTPSINNFEIQKLISQHGWGTVGLVSSNLRTHDVMEDVYGTDPEERSFFRIRANGERRSSVWIGVGIDGDVPRDLSGGGGTVTEAPIPYGISLPLVNRSCDTVSWSIDVNSDYYDDIKEYELQILDIAIGWVPLGRTTSQDYTLANQIKRDDFIRIRTIVTNGASIWGYGKCGDEAQTDYGLIAPNPYNVLITTPTGTTTIEITWLVDINYENFDYIRYEVQILNINNEWVTLSDSSLKSYTATRLDPGTIYYFRVRTVTNFAVSAWVGVYGITTGDVLNELIAPNPYDILIDNETDNTLRINWEIDSNYLNTDNLRYEIQILNINNEWASLAGISTKQHTVMNLLPGTIYYFRIRTVINLGVSDWIGISGRTTGDNINIETVIPVPENIMWKTATTTLSQNIFYGVPDSNLGFNQIKFTWTAPDVLPFINITYYEIAEYTEKINLFITVARISSMPYEYIVQNLELNEEYIYGIRTVTTHGSSEWAILKVRTPDYVGSGISTLTPTPSVISPPINFRQTTSTESTITLEWNDSSPLPPGFTGYKIERYDIIYASEVDIFVPDWAIVEYTSATSSTDIDLECNTKYRYRIQSRTTQGNSEWIEINGITLQCTSTDEVLPPTNFIIDEIATSSLRLNWEPPIPIINNFLFYEIRELFIEEENNEWITIKRISDQTDREITIINLIPGTEYWFGIRTVASQGKSILIAASAKTVGLPTDPTDPPVVPTPILFNTVLPPINLSATTVINATTTDESIKLMWEVPTRRGRTSQIIGFNIYRYIPSINTQTYAPKIEDFVNINNSLIDINGSDLLNTKTETICSSSVCEIFIRSVDIIDGETNLFAVESYDAINNISRRVSTSIFVGGTKILDDVLVPKEFKAYATSTTIIDIYDSKPRVILEWEEPDTSKIRLSDIEGYNLYLSKDVINKEGNTFIPITTVTSTSTSYMIGAEDNILPSGISLESGVAYVFAIESFDKNGVTSRKVFASARATGKKLNARVLTPPDVNGYDIRDEDNITGITATSTYPWIRLEWDHPATSTSPNIAKIKKYNVYYVENDTSVDIIFYTPIAIYGLGPESGMDLSSSTDNFLASSTKEVISEFNSKGITSLYSSSINKDEGNPIGKVCDDNKCGVIVGGIGFRNASFYTFAIESVDEYGKKSIDKAVISVRTHGKRYDAIVPPPLNVRAFSFSSEDNDIYKERPIPESMIDFQRIYLSWKQPATTTYLGTADVTNYNVYYLEHAIEVNIDVHTPLDIYEIIRRPADLPDISSPDQESSHEPIRLLNKKCHDNINDMDFASSTNPQLKPDSLKGRIRDNNCHVAIVEENFIDGTIYTIFVASVDANGRESVYIPVRVRAGGFALKPNGLTVLPPDNLRGSDLSSDVNYQVLLAWEKPEEQYNDATTEQYIVSLYEFAEEVDLNILENIPTAFIMSTTSTTTISGVVYENELYENSDRYTTTTPRFVINDSFSFNTTLFDICGINADNEDLSHDCLVVVGNNRLERGEIYTFAVQSVDSYSNLSRPVFINVRISDENIKSIDSPLLPPLNFRLDDISIRPEDIAIPNQYWIELSWIEPEDVWYYGTIVGYEIQYSEYLEEEEDISQWRIITDDIVKFSNSTTTIVLVADESIGEISKKINTEKDISISQLLRAELCSNTLNCRGAFGSGVLDPSVRYFFRIRSVDSDGNYSTWVDRDIVLDGKKIFKPIHENIKAPNTFRGYDDAEYLKLLIESFKEEGEDRTINFELNENITDNWAILTWREPTPDIDTEDVAKYEISQFSNVTEYDPIEYYQLIFTVSTTSTSTVNVIVSYDSMSTNKIMDVCTGFKPMHSNLNKLVNKKEYYDVWNSDSFTITEDVIFSTTTPRTIRSYFQNSYEFETPDGIENYNVTIKLDALTSVSLIGTSTIGISLIKLDDKLDRLADQYSDPRGLIVEHEYILDSDTKYRVYVWTDNLPVVHRYKLSIIPTNPTVGDEFINKYSGQISECVVAVGEGNLLSGETYRFGIQSVNENIKSNPLETTTVTIAGEKIPPPDGVVAAELYPEPSSITQEIIDNIYHLSGSYYAWPIRLQADRNSPLRIYVADSLNDDCDNRVNDESIYSRTQIVIRPEEDNGLEKKVCLYLDKTDLDTVRLRLYRDTDNKLLETYNITTKDIIGNGVFTFEPILDYYLEGETYLTTLTFLRNGTSTAAVNTNAIQLASDNVRIREADNSIVDDPCESITFNNSTTSMLSLSTSTDLCISIKDEVDVFENIISINATTTVATTTYNAIEEYSVRITEPFKPFQNGICDTNADGILSDNELDDNNDGIITNDDYTNCGFDLDEKYKTECTDRLCLNVALESMCNTAGLTCNGELLRILLVLLVAFGLAAMPLASTAVILSRFTIPAMVFSYLLFNAVLWVGVWLANFPEYWALMPILLTFIFGTYFTVRKFQNR